VSSGSARELKRLKILRCARERFAHHGFDKVSVAEIAATAHVSPATIYNNFGTKANLAREVVGDLVLELLTRYREILASDLPFAAKLEQIVFDKTEIVRQYQGGLLKTVYESDPSIRDMVEGLWRDEFDRLTVGLLEEGRRHGYVTPDVSHEALLLYLEVLRRGVLASSAGISAADASPELIRDLNLLILHGLVGPTG
jgi:AcrR family transcriptional regulator